MSDLLDSDIYPRRIRRATSADVETTVRVTGNDTATYTTGVRRHAGEHGVSCRA
jgi:hypothetical protein